MFFCTKLPTTGNHHKASWRISGRRQSALPLPNRSPSKRNHQNRSPIKQYRRRTGGPASNQPNSKHHRRRTRGVENDPQRNAEDPLDSLRCLKMIPREIAGDRNLQRDRRPEPPETGAPRDRSPQNADLSTAPLPLTALSHANRDLCPSLRKPWANRAYAFYRYPSARSIQLTPGY